MVSLLPHVNATLNAVATILLVAGYLLIKQGREQAHKRVMLSCFGVSVLFLLSYLCYHYQLEGNVKKFPADAPHVVRYGYLAILFTHVVLAAAVPFLAVYTIYLGLLGEKGRTRHRRLARWTFPIWLYVSITGVIVYLLLYQFYAT